MADVTLDPAVVAWDASDKLKIEAFELTVPAAAKGRLDVYKIPKCDAYPEGYFFKLCTGAYYETVEPGCYSWEQTLLCQIQFNGVTSPDEGVTLVAEKPVIIFKHNDLVIDETKLFPVRTTEVA